jgi:hypothetical protein
MLLNEGFRSPQAATVKPQDEPKRPAVAYEANDVGFYGQQDADAYMDYLEGRIRELEASDKR